MERSTSKPRPMELRWKSQRSAFSRPSCCARIHIEQSGTVISPEGSAVAHKYPTTAPHLVPSLPAKSMTAEEISKNRLTTFNSVCYSAYRIQKCAICIISFTLHII